MPCQFCKANVDEDIEVEVCNDCLNFLNHLICLECEKPVSYKKKFKVICEECVIKGQKPEKKQSEKLEKLKEEEKEIKKNIEKVNLENNILNNNPIYDDKKFIDFYDIILKINSIRDVLNGWNIELPIGTSIKTEGISIRCPDMESENQNIILLDSAGSETPLLEDSNFDFNKYISKPKELKEQLENLARDKSLTENFLQNIIINESNMLLILVGNLTYPEQKLLNKIRENKKQNLYVIHNLQTFIEKNQVEH